MPFGDEPDKEQIDAVQRDLATIEHHWHSRWRVYPQDVTVSPLIASVAVANTFGAWVQILPINTIPFDFDVVGLVVEQVSAITVYHFQVGYSTTAVAPGVNMECGERRVRMATAPVARATELLEIRGQEIPANSSVWMRVKTATAIADTANVSIVLSRHVEISNQVPIWPAFPW